MSNDNYITNIFKIAVHTENEEQQGDFLSKGCKIITDSIKQKDQFDETIANQKGLIQYMILSIPIFGDNIELIIESILEFYYGNQEFMLNFWDGLEKIAQINENDLDDIKKYTHNQKKISILTVVDQKLSQNLICEKALKYTNLYVKYINNNEFIMNNINIFKIFLQFVQNTENEKLLKQTCCVLEQAKQLYNYQCFKSDIQTQIEDYLIKRMDIKNSIDDSPSVDIQKYEQQIHSKINNIQKFTNIRQNTFQENNDEVFKVSVQDLNKQQLIKNLEIWLQSALKDQLILTKSEFIQSFLKEDENLEIYFQFFMDPYQHCSSMGFQKYVSLLDKQFSVPEILFESPLFRKNKSFVPKTFNYYCYRSYKVALSFIQLDNYQRLLRINPNLVVFYFKTLYSTLQDMEQKSYIPYINHIIKTLRHLILNYDQNSSGHPILEFCKNNFIFKFLEFLDFQSMDLFIYDILGVSNNCIFSSFQRKFWKYLLTTKFFIELSRIMVYHDFSQSIGKFDNNYLMTDIKIEIRQEKLDQNQEINYKMQKSVNNNYHLKNTNMRHLIYEDFNIHTRDIDRMKKICAQQIREKYLVKDCSYLNRKKTLKINEMKFSKVTQPTQSVSAIQRVRGKFLNINRQFVENLLNLSRQVKNKVIRKKNLNKFHSLNNLKVEVTFNKVVKNQSIIVVNQYVRSENLNVIQQQKKNEIYPYSMNEISFCEMEDKKRKYFNDIKYLLSFDKYSQKCAQIIEMCINTALDQKYSFIYSKIVDYKLLVQAILKPDKYKVFQDILENYLFKYELNLHLEHQNSSLICGRIINKILKNIDTIDAPDLLKITDQYFMILNRLIVKSMDLFPQKNNIYAQDLVFQGGFRTCRFQIVETFYYFLKNSKKPKKLLNQVLIPTWDCLIVLFFNFKLNSIYFTLFQKIMQIVADSGDESIFFNIFIKLNLFSKLVQTFQTIYMNSVLLTEMHVGEQFVAILNICQTFIKCKEKFSHESLIKIKFWDRLQEIIKIGQQSNLSDEQKKDLISRQTIKSQNIDKRKTEVKLVSNLKQHKD